MRKLVLLVCMVTMPTFLPLTSWSGILPNWESPDGTLGFFPITNEVSLYENVDDGGNDRGGTLQIVSINSFKLLTTFNFEFTGDFNWRYSYRDPFDVSQGMNNYDYYFELSLVKPVTPVVSVNIQRIVSTFEEKPINQFGIRLSF